MAKRSEEMKKDHFLFERKNDYFAVPIDEVSEIIETKITKKRTTEEKSWIGLISNRNLLVPVFDSSELHNWDSEHIDEKEYTVIIINYEKTVYGLIMLCETQLCYVKQQPGQSPPWFEGHDNNPAATPCHSPRATRAPKIKIWSIFCPKVRWRTLP